MIESKAALPSHWEYVPLGSEVTLINGRAYKKPELLDAGPTPVLRVGNFFSNRSWYYSDLKLPEDKYCHEGDLLFAWSASFGPKIWDGPTAIYHYHIWKIEMSPRVDKLYLYYLLYSISAEIKSEGNGIAMIHATKGGMEKRKIPLPPLAEQQKIAAILDAADQLRQKDQQLNEHYTRLSQSLFLKMFGDPVANNRNWPVKKIADVATTQLGKMLSKKAKQGLTPSKYLRNANVRWRHFKLDEVYEMDFDEKEKAKFNLKNGDLLVCEGGDVGRCAIWKENLENCYFQKALHRVRVDEDSLTPEYMQEYFYWMAKLGGLASSVSEVTFSHLTGEKLRLLKIPLPPIEMQTKYALHSSIIEQQKQQAQASLEKSNDLFNSLLQRAFKGELTA